MIHDQYLKGNLSPSQRPISPRRTALRSSVQIKPGETLVLDLDTVIYNSTGGVNGSSGQAVTGVHARIRTERISNICS
ncbi:hypothetical protein AOLI_G00276650 [Acnodon oligacanthus]